MSPVTQVRDLTPQEVATRRCQTCGHVGTDVVPMPMYQGGVGYVTRYFCVDSDACWDRWEALERMVS